jgi:hypothetical protein
MAALEFIQTYIDDLLYITKGSLDDHLAKLRTIFIRLRDAGLKALQTEKHPYTTHTLVNGKSVREDYGRFGECKGGVREILRIV